MSAYSTMSRDLIQIESDNITYTETAILSSYAYETVSVTKTADGAIRAKPVKRMYQFRVERTPARMGLMIVGLGGNNGTTVTAGVIANRENITWRTNRGVQHPDYIGSLSQMATVRLGFTPEGEEVHVPFWKVLPMVNPNDLVIGGWDISKMNLGDAMRRAAVLDFDLQEKVYDHLQKMAPLPSVYYPDFISANQSDRADNVLPGSKKDHLEQIRKDIRNFKSANNLDKVVVLWSANTERYSDVIPGIHDTAENLLAAIERGESEIAPSVIFALASILEGTPFINGSPQNSLLPGVVELAKRRKVHIGGDDFKSGQTKLKSVLMDFLVSAGIKPMSIASYNHLGNNDGKNLNSPQQFRSKEISKSNVVDDMVNSNELLYGPGEKPDHCVVIKYVPYVGDSKRALDEYTSRIFMGGHNTLVIHNTCEDSLLAAPLILDLAILTELLGRITFKTEEMEEYEGFDSVLAYLSYMLKAPKVPEGMPIVNALSKQRSALENIFRACLSLPPENHLLLEHVTGTFEHVHGSRKGTTHHQLPDKSATMSDSSLAAYVVS